MQHSLVSGTDEFGSQGIASPGIKLCGDCCQTYCQSFGDFPAVPVADNVIGFTFITCVESGNGFGFLSGEEMFVAIHRQRDARISHPIWSDIGLNSVKRASIETDILGLMHTGKKRTTGRAFGFPYQLARSFFSFGRSP
jgi:hypothetical protein